MITSKNPREKFMPHTLITGIGESIRETRVIRNIVLLFACFVFIDYHVEIKLKTFINIQ